MKSLKNLTKRMVSVDLATEVYQLIASNNKVALHKIGIDDATIEHLQDTKMLDLNPIINAFEQAISFETHIDTHIIRKILTSNLKHSQTDNLINKLLLSGAPFSMMRYFFRTYTNRQHTELRKMLEVDDEQIACQYIQVPQQVADDFFAIALQSKKKIDASDLLKLSDTNHYSIRSIWKEFKTFTQNCAPY